jgi:CRP/FNR family nitrogen fixation transcriptional regulator
MDAATSTAPASQTGRIRQLMSTRSHPLQRFDPIAVVTTCRRRQEICSEGQAANYWYYLVAGAAARSIITSEGRRQVVDLLLPGDFFSILAGQKHDSTTEAVAAGTIVAAYPRRRIERQAESDSQLECEIRQLASETLIRLQTQLLILGHVTAAEKVGAFILAMAERLSKGQDDCIALPLSRYDIADYLAISVETVSRALTDLKQRGLIKFVGTRLVKIIDQDALDGGDRDERRSC